MGKELFDNIPSKVTSINVPAERKSWKDAPALLLLVQR